MEDFERHQNASVPSMAALCALCVLSDQTAEFGFTNPKTVPRMTRSCADIPEISALSALSAEDRWEDFSDSLTKEKERRLSTVEPSGGRGCDAGCNRK